MIAFHEQARLNFMVAGRRRSGLFMPLAQVRRPIMAVTHKSLRSIQGARSQSPARPHRFYTAIYAVTLLLAAVAIYIVLSLLVGKAHVLLDDLRYGRPRTMQIDAFVG